MTSRFLKFRLIFSFLLISVLAGMSAGAQNTGTDGADGGRFLNPGFGFKAKAEAPKKVTASLAAAQTAVVPGQPMQVALKLEHPPQWHTYWINPGFGTPTKMRWKLPEGWKAGQIIWPIPQIKPTELGNTYILGDTAWLFTTLVPPANLAAGGSVKLEGNASWLLCDEGSQCMPGSALVELDLPVAAEAQPVAEVAAEMEKVRAQQPQSPAAWKITSKDEGKTSTFVLEPGEGASADPGDICFFDRAAAISNQPQQVKREGNNILITMVKSEEAGNKIPSGYIRASKGWLADGSVPALAAGYVLPSRGLPEDAPLPAAATLTTGTPAPGPAAVPVETPVVPAAASVPAPPVAPPAAQPPAAAQNTPAPAVAVSSVPTDEGISAALNDNPKIGFWLALLSLFLAGMILNLMPCVFPVLAIKVLGFVQSAGKNPSKTMKHSLAYTAGLLLFVWLLAAGMFIAVSSFGVQIAWGDITRYSGPLAGVVILLFLMGLNLAGVFEFGTKLTTVGGDLQDKDGYAGSFWSGALTTLISTPCSGPFMALAMGFALKQGLVQQFILFTAFGLGIALPYVVLSCSPGLIKKLPKPGAWMETFKKALSFPMFAAALFFLNAFASKTGTEGAGLLLWALILTAIAAWIYGTWNTPARSGKAHWIGGLTALAFAAGAVELARLGTKERAPDPGADVIYKTGDLAWSRWSPEKIAELRAQGKPVFVNFTTINCYTCEVNEKKVFLAPVGSSDVIRKFADSNAVAVRAKYLANGTPQDEAILKSLEPWGISTFPFYLMYPADASKPPFVVSDALLSQSDVIQALEKAVQ